MSGGQGVPSGQAAPQSVSVLSLPEVPRGRHGEGGGAHRLAKRTPRTIAVEAQISAGIPSKSPRVHDHGPCAGPRRLYAGHIQPGVRKLPGTCRQQCRAFGGGQSAAVLQSPRHLCGRNQVLCGEAARVQRTAPGGSGSAVSVGEPRAVCAAIGVPRAARRHQDDILQRARAAQVPVPEVVRGLAERHSGVQQESAQHGD